MAPLPALPAALLPGGIRARHVEGVNGLRMHVLEAGRAGDPVLLLLHGFPELAYSWRKVMPALAEAGYHVIAPDQRGYGRTTGWDGAYDGDVGSFRLLNLVRDVMGLLARLGVARVAGVVGHDFGASVAAWAALTRPDIFPRLVLMSAPFTGAPRLAETRTTQEADIHAALAALARPRKHYQWYYSGRSADADMLGAPGGLHAFLRGYYHHKSADWPGNRPHALAGWNAEALADMPTYYIMDLAASMPESVVMPDAATIAACTWLSEAELGVYAGEFARTGFQGALNWYRCRTGAISLGDLEVFAGRQIEVPAAFIAGAQDWGIHQVPGALERMREEACARMGPPVLVEGAGHWVQQERPGEVVAGVLGVV
ncbi:MAG: alpha/beta fold hydrolase [Rhodospirillales bacterium]|nr:alpha/beta fold hydrolase [Rhodospirillales bacterium]